VSAAQESAGSRPTLGWLIATLTGGALFLGSTGCSSTPEDEPAEDIEVHLPTQAEADANANRSIAADDAEAEYKRLLEELEQDG
jgi:hypothetical protein